MIAPSGLGAYSRTASLSWRLSHIAEAIILKEPRLERAQETSGSGVKGTDRAVMA